MSDRIVTLPFEQFLDPVNGSPLFDAKIYIGQVDTDPKIPANQLQVFYVQEDGSKVNIPQPVRTNAAGFTINNQGDVIQIRVDSNYSMRVLEGFTDAEIAQYSIPDNSESAAASVKYVDDGDFSVREDLLGPSSNLYMGNDGVSVKVGDTVPAGTTHLRYDSEIFLVYPSASISGVVDSINAGGVTLDGQVYLLAPDLDRLAAQPSVYAYSSMSEAYSGSKSYQQVDVDSRVDVVNESGVEVTGAEINQTTNEVSSVYYSATVGNESERITVSSSKLTQPQNDTTPNNNHGIVKFSAVDFGSVIGCESVCDIFTTQAYGYSSAGLDATKSSSYGRVIMNTAKVSGMFDEILGGDKGLHGLNIVVGGRPSGGRTRSHGYRISGYDGARAVHNAHFNSYISGMNTGFSYQKTARYNNATGNVIHDVNEAVQITTANDESDQRLDSYPQANNRNHAVVHNANIVVNALGTSYSDYDFVADDITGIALNINADPNGVDYSIGNRLRGIYTNISGNVLDLDAGNDGNVVDFQCYDVTGRPFIVDSNKNLIRVVAKNCGARAVLFGDDNLVELVFDNVSVGSECLEIVGDNNTITINTDKNLLISGSNNKIVGRIGGYTDNGSGNDLSGVYGYRQRGKFNGTTDSSGYINIPHGISSYYLGLSQLHGSAGWYTQLSATNPNSMVLRVFQGDGNPATNSAVTVSWQVETAYAG